MANRYSVYFGSGADPEEAAAPAPTPAAPGNAKFEPRVDEEQLQKFNEIVEMLVAGGYFRARINGLSPFDKVIGGMAWSITASNVDIDVDVFFQENSTIGQKILLSEALIVALRKMKCPYPIQAQHIQGLNYMVLFPVIQFLIKKVIETREETGDLLRIFSESQFGKSFKTPADVDFETRKQVAVAYATDLEDRYKPQRSLKRQKTASPTVQQTLLEYGKLNRMSKTVVKQNEKADAIAEKLGKAKQETVDQSAEEERRISGLIKAMDSVESKKITIKGIISAEQIERASQIEGADASDAVAGAGQKNLAEKQHKSKVANLNKQIEHQTELLEKAKADRDEQATKADSLNGVVTEKLTYNERVITATGELDKLETEANAKQLATLRNLVGLNENLINQESLFKANCKKQLLHLQGLISAIEKESQVPTEDAARRELVKETFTADKAKAEKILQLRNKKNRDIALLERKIDEVPSRGELMQYQRQFVDLYEQVSSRLTETRQHYSSYNAFVATRDGLASEVTFLNSIQDGYKSAMSSKQKKEKFIESLETYNKALQQKLDKEESRAGGEKKTNDDLNNRYLKLVEKERLFYKITKEFQEECKLNEELQSKLGQ